MRFAIYHLSDIHIRSNRDPVLSRAKQIAGACIGVDPHVDGCVIATSGDVAFSGTKEEYDLAEMFFAELKREFQNHSPKTTLGFIFAPGNHDCLLIPPDDIRNLVVDGLNSGKVKNVSTKIVSQCVAAQDNYFNFIATVTGASIAQSPYARMMYEQPFTVGGKTVLFRTFNTAWMSQVKETQGQLLYPTETLTLAPSSDALVVSMFHHPYNWLEASNARSFRRIVEQTSDVILTGHEHDPSLFSKRTRASKTQTDYLEGGVLQDPEDMERSVFNVLIIDFVQQKEKHYKLEWKVDLYASDAAGTEWADFQRNRRRLRTEFEISDRFFETLTNAGAAFTHPRKDRVLLDDVFVEPDVEELTQVDQQSQLILAHLNGERLWARILQLSKVRITGEEASGKSTLAKRLFIRLRDQGFVPVLLRGLTLTACDKDYLLNAIDAHIKEQYSADLVVRFRQLPPSQRALIIDDYHSIPLNRAGRQKILEALAPLFTKQYLFAHDLALVEEMSYEGGADNPLLQYNQFELKEFGNQLREFLVEKWISIGHEFDMEASELERLTISTKRLVDTTLGKNLLPSYPIYILIILQQIEAFSNINTSSGAHGYLYEALITRALAKTSKRLDLDTAYNYLSGVADQMFKGKKRHLTNGEMQDWHEKYCDDYKISLKFDRIEKALTDAEILSVSVNSYSFKFKYLYFYFVARHLRDQLNTDDGRKQLTELISNVYREEYANILMFLTYLSKESIVVEEMLRVAKSIYPDTEPCDFKAHTKFVSNLHERLPKSILVDKSSKVARREINEAIDKLEGKKNTEERDFDDALKLNVAFKTIQILGQILKNFPGSLKGDVKYGIATECYALGLRTMRTVLRVMEDNADEIVKDIAERMLKDDQGTSEARLRRAKRILSFLVEGLSFAIIKRVSGSVGSETLRQTYKELLDNKSSLPVKIIDLAVKLDYFQQFPEEEFDGLVEETEKDVFPTLILRHLVFDHFYRFPRSREVKQKYCSKLKIELKAVNLLEMKRGG